MMRLKKLLLILLVIQVVNTVSGIILNNIFLNQRVGDGEINVFGVSTKAEEKIKSTNFRGGYLRAAMGAVNLDLTEATIENPPATIKTMVVMGRATITVPRHWKVRCDTRNIMGSVPDVYMGGVSDGEDLPDLVLTGKVVMGGLAINHENANTVIEAV